MEFWQVINRVRQVFTGGDDIMENGKVNCKKCMYHYITWDNSFPYGCKLYGVKSKQLPSVIVSQSIGKACDSFLEKKAKG